jgi:kynurenine formamidase
MSDVPELPEYDDLPAGIHGGRLGWHLFGNDDSVGLLHLQTLERIAAAAALVRRGAVFSLNAPLTFIDPPMFDREPLQHEVIDRAVGLDDRLDVLYPQASSQWDAIAHVPYDDEHYYNGVTRDQIAGEQRGTIDHWARRGIAGRAVLLDLEATLSARGAYRPDESRAFTVDDLEQAREDAAVEIRTGDILLIHTGWLDWYRRQPAEVRAPLRDRANVHAVGVEHTESMARHLWNLHVCGVATDSIGVEVWPPDHGLRPFGFLHRMLLGSYGMALGEMWWLHDLARDCAEHGVYEMLLTSAPLNVPGGIGSPPNALALL